MIESSLLVNLGLGRSPHWYHFKQYRFYRQVTKRMIAGTSTAIITPDDTYKHKV